MNLLLTIQTYGQQYLGALWPLVWTLVKIVCITLPVMGCVAYLTLWERKMIGWMHIRLGPNRVGPAGLGLAAAQLAHRAQAVLCRVVGRALGCAHRPSESGRRMGRRRLRIERPRARPHRANAQ